MTCPSFRKIPVRTSPGSYVRLRSSYLMLPHFKKQIFFWILNVFFHTAHVQNNSCMEERHIFTQLHIYRRRGRPAVCRSSCSNGIAKNTLRMLTGSTRTATADHSISALSISPERGASSCLSRLYRKEEERRRMDHRDEGRRTGRTQQEYRPYGRSKIQRAQGLRALL